MKQNRSKRSEELHESNPLRPYEDCGAIFSDRSGDQKIGDCPLCGKEGKFYVRDDGEVWDCKRCGASGNLGGFLGRMAKEYYRARKKDKTEMLAGDRKLPEDAFKNWIIGWDEASGAFTLPVKNAKGTVVDLRRFKKWDRDERASWHSTRGCHLGLLGAERLAKATPGAEVWLCEGEWDTVAWRWILRQAGETDAVVVGVPGAGTFKDEWVDLFRGMRVRLCYDHDEAGRKGDQKAWSLLQGVAKEILSTHWPLTFEDGADIRDFVTYAVREGISAEDCTDGIKRKLKPEPVSGKVPPPKATKAGPAVEPFPLSVLPKKLHGFIEEAVEAFGCPPDYFAVPMLVIASGALGNSAYLRVKASWSQRANLYAGVVGSPGSKKTPALGYLAGPLHEIESDHLKVAYGKATVIYLQKLEEYGVELRHWKEAKKDTGPRMKTPPPLPPEKPVRESALTTDTTVEALAEVLAGSKRGVVLLRDELVGWVLSLDQYRAHRGADRQFFLSCWSGEPIKVNRVHRDEPIDVRRPFLSIVGGVVPDMLAEFRDTVNREDGFVDRILFSYPDEVPPAPWNNSTVDDEVWRRALRRLWERKPENDDEGDEVRLSKKAQAAWAQFYNDVQQEISRQETDFLKGALSKLASYGARFALLLHALDEACAPPAPNDEGMILKRELTAATVARAVKLVGYFKSHLLKVRHCFRFDPMDRKVETIVRWIGKRKGEVSVRDFYTQNVGGLKKRSEAEEVVREIEDRGLAIQEETESGPKGGRRREVVRLTKRGRGFAGLRSGASTGAKK